jgi:hypothetical protein
MSYTAFQIEKYGNVLAEDGFTQHIMPCNQEQDEDFEDGYTEDQKAQMWAEHEAYLQMLNDERTFPHNEKSIFS